MNSKIKLATQFIEWKPFSLRGHGVFCRDCNCFLAMARDCSERTGEQFKFEYMNAVNIRLSRRKVMCRCGTCLGYVSDDGFLHLSKVVGRDLDIDLQNNQKFDFIPHICETPINGFICCLGCKNIICPHFGEGKQNDLAIEVPAYIVANIKLNNDMNSEFEPNAAVCYCCGFAVGDFADDKKTIILDDIFIDKAIRQ